MNLPTTDNDTWNVLGVGAYGVIVSRKDSTTCRKIFTRDRAFSFIRESYIIKRLSHISGITEIINLDTPTHEDIEIVKAQTSYFSKRDHNCCWGVLVMKRYQMTLGDWLRSRPTYDDRIAILTKIIRIMADVHNNGVIHADIKLENIMLTETGDVKVIDWGLSGSRGSACIYGTTRTYRPKTITQDFCHDIYALGVLSVELVLGSVMINAPEYGACLRLLDSVTMESKLRKLIIKMLHPDCYMRPDINEVAQSFGIQTSVTSPPPSSLVSLPILNKHYNEMCAHTRKSFNLFGDMIYPVHFKLFLDEYPEMAVTVVCVLIALYHSGTITKTSDLLKYVNYTHVCTLIDFI